MSRTMGMMMRLANRLLRPVGIVVLPAPPSAKMLHEYANVGEAHHPARGGRMVAWMRRAADLIPEVDRG